MGNHPNGIYNPKATYVTATTWGISYSMESWMPALWSGKSKADIDPTVTLNVHRLTGRRDDPIEKHPEHDGKTFPTEDDAHQYALDHGLIAVYRTRTSQPGITIAHDGEVYAFGVASSWKATRNPRTARLTLTHADGHTVAAGHPNLDGLIRSHAFLIVREMESRGILGRQATAN